MAKKPKRIQRKRTKGWRMPPNAVYVGRPSKWGNPYKVGREGTALDCVFKYQNWIMGNIWSIPNPQLAREELRDKDLVCWCALDVSCHADILLEIANG